MMQVVLMTSDKQDHLLPGFFRQWQKYFPADVVGVITGFRKPPNLPQGWRFVSHGKQEDYPPKRWSERLMQVCDEIADDVFMLLLEDYWLYREADTCGLKMIYDYMHQYRNVLKFDLATDRLYANRGEPYLYDMNTYDTLGYLDLIKSDYKSAYHMSLWGGMYRRDLLKKILIPGETAQEIEVHGTNRLAAFGDEILVLGTRQAPLRHINAIIRGGWNMADRGGIPSLTEPDREALRSFGYNW